jgi:hypothetical protein
MQTPAETTGGDPILDLLGEPIDPIWAAEFRGFFWGEGSLIVSVKRPPRATDRWIGYSYNVHTMVSQRSDDEGTLEEFQRRLGGTICVKQYNDGSGKTLKAWTVSCKADCERLARVLAGGSAIPFAKKKQLALWSEAVEIRRERGYIEGRSRYTPDERERLLAISQEIRAMRTWVG